MVGVDPGQQNERFVNKPDILGLLDRVSIGPPGIEHARFCLEHRGDDGNAF
jgi:hypothetical protein